MFISISYTLLPGGVRRWLVSSWLYQILIWSNHHLGFLPISLFPPSGLSPSNALKRSRIAWLISKINNRIFEQLLLNPFTHHACMQVAYSSCVFSILSYTYWIKSLINRSSALKWYFNNSQSWFKYDLIIDFLLAMDSIIWGYVTEGLYFFFSSFTKSKP